MPVIHVIHSRDAYESIWRDSESGDTFRVSAKERRRKRSGPGADAGNSRKREPPVETKRSRPWRKTERIRGGSQGTMRTPPRESILQAEAERRGRTGLPDPPPELCRPVRRGPGSPPMAAAVDRPERRPGVGGNAGPFWRRRGAATPAPLRRRSRARPARPAVRSPRGRTRPTSSGGFAVASATR